MKNALIILKPYFSTSDLESRILLGPWSLEREKHLETKNWVPGVTFTPFFVLVTVGTAEKYTRKYGNGHFTVTLPFNPQATLLFLALLNSRISLFHREPWFPTSSTCLFCPSVHTINDIFRIMRAIKWPKPSPVKSRMCIRS